MQVRDVIAALDIIAPPHLKYGNDPTGLLIGDMDSVVTGIAVALDVTAAVVAAAKARGAQMIIAHHPLIYHPLKTIRADVPHPGGVALQCIRHGMSVACAHTNWDIAPGGVNDVLADLLGLIETRPLHITYREPLIKIAVFTPTEHHFAVLEAMAAAGAGAIPGSNYDRCGFWTAGTGTFRALTGAKPFLGVVGEPETAREERLEMICPEAKFPAVIAAMREAHPYEEVAYDVYPLKNAGAEYGLGRVGILPEPMPADAFLARIKNALNFEEVRMMGPRDRLSDRFLRTVAVGGGACAEFTPDAIAAGADAFVTSDIRHHEFVDAAERGFLLIDAGHAATETPGAAELANRLASALPQLTVTFHQTAE